MDVYNNNCCCEEDAQVSFFDDFLADYPEPEDFPGPEDYPEPPADYYGTPSHDPSRSPAPAQYAAAPPIQVTVNVPVCSPQPIKIRGCNGYCPGCPYRDVCGELI